MPLRSTAPLYSAASSSLDFSGDTLREQLAAQEIERKKKLMRQAQAMGGGMGAATMALFPQTGLGM